MTHISNGFARTILCALAALTLGGATLTTAITAVVAAPVSQMGVK